MKKILSRKKIIDTGFIKLYEDEVELKNKEKRKYISGERVPAVSVFPFTNEGELVLIKEFRYIHKTTLIETVAGTIEKGETPIDTVKRELLEEAGIRAVNIEMIGQTIAAGSFITWDQYIFIARDLTFEKQRLEDSEEIKIFKIPIEKAVEMVVKGDINTATTTFGILLIDHLIRNNKL